MIFSKTIFSLVLATLLLTSCKDKTTVASNDVESTTNKKELVAVQPQTASFKIEGMVCAVGCAKTIENKLAKMEGIQKATIDFNSKQATVNYDLDKLTEQDIVKAVEATGDGKTYKVILSKTGNKV